MKANEYKLIAVDMDGTLLNDNKEINVNTFASQWQNSLLSNWPTVAAEHGWNQDSYSSSHYDNPNYIGG